MGDEPSETDKALFERLNALKPSSVQLERRKLPLDSSSTEPAPDLDLSARFASLGTSTFISNKAAGDATAKSLGYEDATDIPAESTPSIPGHRNDDKEHIQNLVHDAKAALDRSKELEDSTKSSAKDEAPRHPVPRISESGSRALKSSDKDVWQLGDPASDSDENFEETDDEQADEILQNIIDELEVEPEPSKADPAATSPTPPPVGSDKELDPKVQQTDLSPGTHSPPSPVPSPKPTSEPEPPSIQNLPDAPTFVPEQTEDHDISSFSKGSSWKNDDTTAHWCCICSDDATRRCFGCEGDSLYCVRCWNEAHLEEGFEEEREHQWVRWTAPDHSK